MDGGRVLRALLAMRMDRTRATRIAALIGQGLAFLFGLWGFMRGDFFLVLIAVFIWLGAGQESQQVVVKDLLRDVKVRKAMTVNPQVLKANEPLSKAVELTLSSAQSDFPVVEWGSNKVVGVLGEAELVRGLNANDRQAPIREVMRGDVPLVQADQPLYAALETMIKSRARAVPVVDAAGTLVGLLTTSDINEAYRLFALEQKLAQSAE
jgi:CBS domain-containing protein